MSQVRAASEWDIELNTRREIPYLQATIYYFVYYINTLLTRQKSTFQVSPHLFMALNRVSHYLIGDLKHTWNYRNFLRAEIRFFSVVEIPIELSTLNKKYILRNFKNTLRLYQRLRSFSEYICKCWRSVNYTIKYIEAKKEGMPFSKI